MNSINLFSAENQGGRIDVGQATGSTETLMFVYDLAPGSSSSPYHYEYDEEWLLVVDGTVVVRTPEGEQTLERGELVRFPSGPAGAHKVMNRSDSPARTLLFSRRGEGYAVSVSAAPPCPGPTAKKAGTRPRPARVLLRARAPRADRGPRTS